MHILSGSAGQVRALITRLVRQGYQHIFTVELGTREGDPAYLDNSWLDEGHETIVVFRPKAGAAWLLVCRLTETKYVYGSGAPSTPMGYWEVSHVFSLGGRPSHADATATAQRLNAAAAVRGDLHSVQVSGGSALVRLDFSPPKASTVFAQPAAKMEADLDDQLAVAALCRVDELDLTEQFRTASTLLAALTPSLFRDDAALRRNLASLLQ